MCGKSRLPVGNYRPHPGNIGYSQYAIRENPLKNENYPKTINERQYPACKRLPKGKAGFDTFSHYKSIVDKKTLIDLPMRYQPFDKLKDKLIRMFMK